MNLTPKTTGAPNNVGGGEPLITNPVNGWTATLIPAVALDLAASHAQGQRAAS